MHHQRNEVMKDLLGKLLYYILDKLIDSIDWKDWVEKYAEQLLDKLLAQIDVANIGETFQTKVLDKLKKWLEKKLNVNL